MELQWVLDNLEMLWELRTPISYLLGVYTVYKFVQINARIANSYITQSERSEKNWQRTLLLEDKIDKLQDDVTGLKKDNMRLDNDVKKYYKAAKRLYELWQSEKSKRLLLEDRVEDLESKLARYRETHGELPDDK